MGKNGSMTRKDFLRTAGMSAAGVAFAATGVGSLLLPKKAKGAVQVPSWPDEFVKNYKELDLDEVRERAYYSYKEAG